ncbi:MarR family winged helix-turn-helix transcriptional regulator [Demequina globuliformis]|uniref:MarR family winged helix-turn-helix transcriptional regulator n=1 Tax=Demequina globuliformis TaxID=676202 RepID=UPI000783B0E5|nr:MarR family transcriptional regulator [Demequina globuliformis]
MSERADAVDYFVQQWAQVRPELDVTPMALIGRVSRVAVLVQAKVDAVFAEHGMQSWEFDVLATLRRAGEPYTLTPGQLDRTMMITSGTTTHRITRLEERGWVQRERDDKDRRSVRVSLTPSGLAQCDRVQEEHLANERAILEALEPDQRDSLISLMRTFALALGDRAPMEEQSPDA